MDRSQGPFLIGLTMNIFLYGVTTTQAYLYFTKYKRDRLWLRALIVILYLAETLNCIISIYYIYDVLITHFGASSSLTVCFHPLFTLSSNYSLQGTIGGAVQHFFAWRVHVLTKNVFVVAAIVLCSLASLAASLSAVVSMVGNPSLSLLENRGIEVTVWLAGGVIADMIIAISLVWYLGRHKHLYPALTSTINRILWMTVQSGVLTTIVAITDLACYLTIVSDDSLSHLIFSMTLSKLYTNCMLSTLNARGTWKYDRSSEDEVSHGRNRVSAFNHWSFLSPRLMSGKM
ncbi:hypothetical protein PISMIDRAFT_107460 [Pisolithus microcarpus 441]|uniref:DUF6534 domain-containing protein n=1 Tax=Pisolithus microcarpus 441 TaxID=765257 RepID=A0A0C9ZHM6_9AGAM|nr:hypothetical protein BKA83DRAFT_107460 [Pisolithus microcarpus]KIK19483.1 hypothetical protein PISMIDRAFT_107460 [Pisolithus microcarpus 441]